MNKFTKTALLYGVIAGAVCMAFFMLLYSLGMIPLGSKKLPDFGINILFMIGAMWQWKRNNGGYISTGEGIGMGYLVNFVAVLVSGLLIYLFLTYIDTNLLPKYIQESLHIIDLKGAEHTKTFGEKSFSDLKIAIQNTTPFDMLKDEVVKKMLFGILPILIIALIFRKNRELL